MGPFCQLSFPRPIETIKNNLGRAYYIFLCLTNLDVGDPEMLTVEGFEILALRTMAVCADQ